MALLTKAIKGTQDVLPSCSYINQFIEQNLLEIAENFGFKEIRTPVFEHTELFQRGVGDTTDVVQKEMYTFNDKGGRSVTLKPEGTAGAARAYLEHGLFNETSPQKVSYITPCYRYEKPQAGRYREFHQFGVECFGTASAAADAELIALAQGIFDFFGVEHISLELNSIGCPECRKKYHEALKEYFSQRSGDLCATCNERLERNPMRILDCKSPVCSEIAGGAPTVLEYICEDCTEHFEKVKQYLDAMGISYKINPKIVRGLDYYTRTVFEFVTDQIGAQGTVIGGGRYDGLIEELGGAHTPSLGFAMGLERFTLLLQAQGIEIPGMKTCDIYIANIGENARLKAMQLVSDLRGAGMSAQFDISERSLKAQMKYSDKINAAFTLVLGDDDLDKNTGMVKNMETGEKNEISLDDFEDGFLSLVVSSARNNLADSFLIEN